MACIDPSSGVLVSFIKRGYNSYAMREKIYSLVRNTELHAPIKKEKVLHHLLYICIFYCILWSICDTEIKFLYLVSCIFNSLKC